MSGRSPQLTLKKGAPGDQVRDLLCLQVASYLVGGPLMWMMPLHLHVNQKSDSYYIYLLNIERKQSSGINHYHYSVTNVRKMMCNNLKLDFVNINAYTVKSQLSEHQLSETTGSFEDDGRSRLFSLLSIAIKLPII